jgi:xylulokinase
MVNLLLGIDYGTTGYKVALFDARGEELAAAAGEVPAVRPARGWVEADAEAVWQSLARAVRSVLAQVGAEAGRIVAVGVTGTSSLVLFGPERRPLRPAILYGDERIPTPEQVVHLVDQVGEARLAEWLGFDRLDASRLAMILRLLPSAKLAWLQAHEPEVFRQIRYVTTTTWDYMNYRLTAVVGQEARSALWDGDIRRALGQDQSWFGAVYASGEIVGTVTEAAAAETGLTPGTPVVMAAQDSLCNFLGGGLTAPGMTLDQAGTTEIIAVVMAERPEGGGYPVPHLLPGLWLLSLSPVRGIALRWFRDRMLPVGATYETMHALAATAPPGAEGLLFLPTLAGEKGVVHDPDARGIFFGLSPQHGLAHLARAMLEGIAFSLRQVLETYQAHGAEIREVRIAGGGARSRLWNQIKADVLGREVGVLKVLETGCLGAAMLAGVGVGLFPDLRAAAATMNRVAEIFSPDPARHARYSALYQVYKELYPAVQPLFPRLTHG